MKRFLGGKKKRRSPTGTAEHHQQHDGLQGFDHAATTTPTSDPGDGPSVGIGEGMDVGIGTSGSRSSASSAKYQYTMRLYQDTADPLTGDAAYKDYNRYENPMNDAHVREGGPGGGGAGGGGSEEMPMAESSVRRRMQEVQSLGAGAGGGGGSGILAGAPTFESLMSMEEEGGGQQIGPSSSQQQRGYVSPSGSAHDVHPPSAATKSVSFDNDHNSNNMYSSGSGTLGPPEPHLPDVTYEEHYGDAYVGKPIKYIYPAGYQSMRPRSRPWKLSIGVFCLFTWLTVFIVGHCSDVGGDEYGYLDDSIDDDTVVIETRWCGSRMLYFMWVMSVLITGLSCAYCSIIGYIQVRDFSIANGRSQPPGMAGRSDYYVNICDSSGGGGGGGGGVGGGASGSYQDGHIGTSIYQADGTPQFWGSHIYKPTQAAVAVTSR